MNIVVIMKMVPDTVEELDIDETNKNLDDEYLRLIPAEQDEHALEEALILKEKTGASVTVLTLDVPGCEDCLFSALAKGANKVIKVPYEGGEVRTSLLAKMYAEILANIPYDLILTGTQAIDDVDGELGALLASRLNLPYVGVAVKVLPEGAPNNLGIVKELGGGLNASFDSPLPLIVGMQSAEKPPRYVPLMKVRNAMKEMQIEQTAVPAIAPEDKIELLKLYKPVVTGGAEMLEGSPEEMVERLLNIFRDKGVT
jgi:electron transfer flavoprotein beta subunit